MIKDCIYKDVKELIKISCSKNKDKIAFQEKKSGHVINYSFDKLQGDINALGTKLLDMGLKGRHIAILGENSYMWIVAYFAVINGVGVVVPIDKELPIEGITQLLEKGDVTELIFTDTFSENIKSVKEQYPLLNNCICMNENSCNYATLQELIQEGYSLMEAGNREFIDAEINPKELTLIIFTSGTTGANKGVMLSHSNILATTERATEYFKDFKRIMAVLPLHHIYQNICGMTTPINMGATVFLNDSLKYLTNNLKSFKPDMAVMVPLFLETMYKKILIEVKKMKMEKTLRYSIKVSNALLKIKLDLRPLWFMKIQRIFGGSLKTIVCGGAFLRPELIQNYRDLGMNIINGYGITECSSLVSVNIGKKLRDDSIGKVVPCNEVKINNPDEDGIGEILVKGNNVMMGYYKDIESTEKSFIDGWFNTGDLGYIDKDENLFMTGRKKNLIVLDNGKNVHPEEIEGTILQTMKYVQEAIVYTSKNKSGSEMIVAAVYIDKDFFDKYDNYQIKRMVNDGLEEVNKKLPGFKKVHRIVIKDEEFKKTTSRKIIRDVFLQEVSVSGRED